MPKVKRFYGGEEKRSHVTMTILQKVDIIKKLDSGSSVNFLAKSYGISARTIYDIKKNKEKILNYYMQSDTNSGLAKRKTIREAKSKDLDSILYEWFRQRRSEGVPISGPILRAKAKELHSSLQIKENYSFSAGWLSCFKKRHGIRYIKASGEKSSADTEAAEEYIEEFSARIQEEKLSPDQIYNADETALFWRCLPRQTLVSSEENAPPGFKEEKERVTVLICSNSAGTHKCKLLLIGKSANPRALKGLKELPVIYRSNKKAWITKELMTEWFENHFVREARKHCNEIGLPSDCKILLIIDNCAAHPELQMKDNVCVRFLPPNTTSLIQPMDQGVIHSLKSFYRQEFLQRLIALNTGVLSDYKKMFSIKDCIFLIAEAWQLVKKDTLINAWHKLWPASLFLDDDNECQKEFSGFCINEIKQKAAELLDFAKSINTTVPAYLDEDQLVEWLSSKDEDEATAIPSITDEEIISSVMNPPEINSDTESEDETKISFDEGLASGYKYLSFLQQNNFISEQEIMFVQRLQKKISSNLCKNLKQTTIDSMFQKINK